MPIYEYRCTSCENTFEDFLKIAERKRPCKKPCPKCGKKTIEQFVSSAPAICDPVRVGARKMDGGFRDVIKKIKKAHPRNNIPDY